MALNEGEQPLVEERRYFSPKRFHSTTKKLYEAWKNGYVMQDHFDFKRNVERKDRGFENVECIVVVSGCMATWGVEPLHSVSSAFVKWLTGYMLEESVIFFKRDGIDLICNNELACCVEREGLIESEEGYRTRRGFPPLKIEKYENAYELGTKLEKVAMDIQSIGNVGLFTDSGLISDTDYTWHFVFRLICRLIDVHDMVPACVHFPSIRDDEELFFMRKAASILNLVWNETTKMYEKVILRDKTVTRSRICYKITRFIRSKKILGPLYKYCSSHLRGATTISCLEYPPTHRPPNDDSLLQWIDSPIFTAICVYVELYYVEVCRMFFADPSPNLTEFYNAIIALQEVVINALKPGVMLKDVHSIGIRYLLDLCSRRVPRVLIDRNSKEIVVAGMAFIVYVELSNFPHENIDGEPCEPVSIAIGDTVIVKADGPNEVLTGMIRKDIDSCTVILDDEESSSEEEAPQV